MTSQSGRAPVVAPEPPDVAGLVGMLGFAEEDALLLVPRGDSIGSLRLSSSFGKLLSLPAVHELAALDFEPLGDGVVRRGVSVPEGSCFPVDVDFSLG